MALEEYVLGTEDMPIRHHTPNLEWPGVGESEVVPVAIFLLNLAHAYGCASAIPLIFISRILVAQVQMTLTSAERNVWSSVRIPVVSRPQLSQYVLSPGLWSPLRVPNR